MQLLRLGQHSALARISSKRCVRTHAKAKGAKGGGGKGQKKGGQSALADLLKEKEKKELESMANPSQYADPEVRALLLQAASSLWKQKKRYLSESDFDALPTDVFNAGFALIINNCYDEEAHKKPIITYANRAGLQLWGARSWNDLVGNRCTPGASDTTESIVEAFQGSINGPRMKILDPTTFCVEDMAGGRIGQALMFTEYEDKAGTKQKVEQYVDPDAAEAAPPRPPPPSEEEIKEAEASAAQWGAYVRQLKEQQGLTNKDPQVVEAVAAMNQWKERLAQLQEALKAELEAAKALFDDEDEEEQGGGEQAGQR